MKKAAIILLTIDVLLGACSSQSNNSEGKVANIATKNEDSKHEETPAKLTLNNGARWHSDSVTNQNVQLLLDIVTSSNSKNIEDYKHMAAKLSEGLDKMIRDCTMKGPDHEALHHWLEPLIEKVNELQDAETIEKADLIFHEINTHLNIYSQYFA